MGRFGDVVSGATANGPTSICPKGAMYFRHKNNLPGLSRLWRRLVAGRRAGGFGGDASVVGQQTFPGPGWENPWEC